MALLLCIETATKVCSVCLVKEGTIIGVEEFEDANYSHSEKLNGLIDTLFVESAYNIKDLDAVVISEGPGSYTGLRIGTSTAKGFCFALDIPLIAINSLKALANLKQGSTDLLCPMFDARRMEVYAAVYDHELNNLMPTEAVVIEESSFGSFLSKNKVCFFGPGAEKCKAIIQHENAIFDIDMKVSAQGMASIGEAMYQNKEFVDVAYFEPYYLKDFIAGKPKKMF
ncbi:tRNA (adenosine(37)-N6)-threonylcarbamoyltransferase complex dimerization subunit type 1 TsaB [Crocinitomix catalasitica]|uniref:tRNA (adenosine(37)-N6)-threonylcarbamoyltransferase complex dimerization subunit type 1 TsaB n=1 Tax=Crocinitomix catalasitica TaxID=184607 RepID=UPI0004861B9B|nr:tRNA (adenosine(37)-N6)-threonylcarbamoyltransferase complex dimerization subunit type 1 TsaB [Crocinitomix catalasitica]